MTMLMPLVNLDAAGPKGDTEVKSNRDGQGFFLGVLESAFAGGAQAMADPAGEASTGETLLDDRKARPAGEDANKGKGGKGADGQEALLAGAMAGLAAAAVPAIVSATPKTVGTEHEAPVGEDAPAQAAGGPIPGINDKGMAMPAATQETTTALPEAASAPSAGEALSGMAATVPEAQRPTKAEASAPAPSVVPEKTAPAKETSAALLQRIAAEPGEGAGTQVAEDEVQELHVVPGLADAGTPASGKEARIKAGSGGAGVNEAPQPSQDEKQTGSAPVIKMFENAEALAVNRPVREAGRPEAGKPAHQATVSAGPAAPPQAQPAQAKAGGTIGGVAPAVYAPAQGAGGDASRGAGQAVDEAARKVDTTKPTGQPTLPEISFARPGQVQAEAAEGAQQPAHAVKEGVLTQFSDGFNTLLKRGGDGVVIRLSPPSLGKIKIEMVTQGHEIRAKVTADNTAVRDILSDNQSSLKSSMQDAGLSLREFSVGVDGGGGGGRWAWSGNGADTGGQPPSGGREVAGLEAGNGAVESKDAPAGVHERLRLNLVV